MADNIAPPKRFFYLLYCDIINLTSLKITQAFHLLIFFLENQTTFQDFKIRNGVRITEGLDNSYRDSDNRDPTVRTYIHTYICYIYLVEHHGI